MSLSGRRGATQGFHESLSRRDARIGPGSNRSFGLVFAAVFTLIGLYPLRAGLPVRLWALSLAAAFLLLAFAAPRLLAPLNRLWFRFGLLLGAIVHPVIVSILFFGVFLPIGLLLRLTGKDLLRREPDPAAASYWIPRTPPGPEPESMRFQF